MTFHKCNMEITERSNIIQYDDMGYPLRLVIVKCNKCGKSDQRWFDTTEEKGDLILQWKKVKGEEE